MHRHGNERTFRPENAARLENPDRLTWLPPGDVVRAMELQPDMSVADLGAGTGYFAIPIARAVPNGFVLAVDFQQEMLDLLARKLEGGDAPKNVMLVRGEARHTTLGDASCDRVLLANVWHELDDWPDVLREVHRILKRGGQLVVVDWRADVPPPPGPPAEHRLSPEEVIAELRHDGWSAQWNRVGAFSYIIRAIPTEGESS